MSLKPIFLAAAASAMLAGCAITNEQAVPDQVTFIGGRLAVSFSNGMKCRQDNIVGSTSGVFSHCPLPVRYDVTMQSRSHLPAGLFEPYADILVTMPDGRSKLLKTPESRNWTEQGLKDID
ncbi:MAG: hypothetical protein Q4G26_02565 [Paracoccus sp. (in: a-proteobacteria)]|nr:hypothetical protein [Paracoccus sp. (in: a-proteobacteria)]